MIAAVAVILDFQSEQILLFLLPFCLPFCLPSFKVNWPIGSGEEAQDRFSSWINDQNDFYFHLQITLILPIKFLVN